VIQVKIERTGIAADWFDLVGRPERDSVLDRLRGLRPAVERASDATPVACPYPEDVLAGELQQNARNWGVLTRLGVTAGTKLPLDFFFETAGPDGDAELAAYLRGEAGYDVVLEAGGLKGRTPPMVLSPEILDEWVLAMLQAGCDHGACAFAGWTATVSRGGPVATNVPAPKVGDIVTSVP
jgi:hypothetical protein